MDGFLKIVVFIVFLAFFSGVYAHDLHLSVTNIDYDADTDEFSLIIKVNRSDLEKSFPQLVPDSSVEQADYAGKKKIAERWVVQYLAISNQRSRARLQYVKTEADTDWVWLYFSFALRVDSDWLITNSLLTDKYPGQVNLMVIQYRERQDGLSFDAQLREKSFQWQK